MSNLEHLIENTLIVMEDDKLCPEDIRKHIQNDINLPLTGLSVDDVWEICKYVKYTWCADVKRGAWGKRHTSPIWFAKEGDDTTPDINSLDFITEVQCNRCYLWATKFRDCKEYKYCPHCNADMRGE